MGGAHKSKAVISAFFIFKWSRNWNRYLRASFRPQFENSISGRFVQSFLNLIGVEKKRWQGP
jgi:hypothetical protein